MVPGLEGPACVDCGASCCGIPHLAKNER
ncbi:MAG: hypothetical protein QOI94_2477, partial [Acidobacteriaceae bacterium]|nr:hypothetical protein [Acidobacteriaceae bacterium]